MRRQDVDVDRIRALSRTHNAQQIADILGCSKHIVYARMREYGIGKAGTGRYAGLENVDTSQYTIKELAKMFNVSVKGMRAKLTKEKMTWKGMRPDTMARVCQDDDVTPECTCSASMAAIRSRSKLARKENEARSQGRHYADLQKEETLEMYGRVII